MTNSDGKSGPDLLNSGGKRKAGSSAQKGAGEKQKPEKQQLGTDPSRGLDDPMNDVPGQPPKDSTWNP